MLLRNSMSMVIKRSLLITISGLFVGSAFALAIALGSGWMGMEGNDQLSDLPAVSVPPANDIAQLVRQADLIVVAEVKSVVGKREIGPYSVRPESSKAIEEYPKVPVTDILLQVSQTLKGSVAEGDTFVLREPGHVSTPENPITETNGQWLYVLGENPDGTFGEFFGNFSRFDLSGPTVKYAGMDIVPALGAAVSIEGFIEAITTEVRRGS